MPSHVCFAIDLHGLWSLGKDNLISSAATMQVEKPRNNQFYSIDMSQVVLHIDLSKNSSDVSMQYGWPLVVLHPSDRGINLKQRDVLRHTGC